MPVSQAAPDLVAICQAYQRFGWAVFPVNGKIPTTRHGCKDASTDQALAKIWYSRYPTRGIALATGKPSGIWVLDIDGPAGEDTLAALEIEHGELPATAEVTTAKGRHLYFRMPEGRDVRNSASQIGEKIDVRGTGGYVVLPPSPHPSGEAYEWARGKKPTKVGIAHAPAWLQEMATAPMQDPETGERFYVPDEIPEGQRDTTIFKLGCSLRAKGLSEEAIYAALLVENRDRCQPPLSDKEIGEKAAQAAKYEAGSPAKYDQTGAYTEQGLRDLTHDGLALDLGDYWKNEAQHVASWGRWLFWDGSLWQHDEQLEHMTRTRAFLRELAAGLPEQMEQAAKRLRNAETVAKVVSLARSNAAQAATVGQWDADTFRLGHPPATQGKKDEP